VTPALYAVFGVIGTFFFVIVFGGAIYLAVKLVQTVHSFRQSLESATEALRAVAPLLKSEEFTRLGNAMILMGKQGASMLQKMEALDNTISLFYKFAVSKNEMDGAMRTSAVAPAPGSGRFSGYSEEKAAAREAAAEVALEEPI